VDTGVFSASLSRSRRARVTDKVQLMSGRQIFIATPTVAELRYGAMVAGWGSERRALLEKSIQAATVVPVTDELVTRVAELRFACRTVGHPLVDRAHTNDLWIAASATHVEARLLTADDIFNGTPGLDLLQ
jgi:predicted nucleic acid-binding protein